MSYDEGGEFLVSAGSDPSALIWFDGFFKSTQKAIKSNTGGKLQYAGEHASLSSQNSCRLMGKKERKKDGKEKEIKKEKRKKT